MVVAVAFIVTVSVFSLCNSIKETCFSDLQNNISVQANLVFTITEVDGINWTTKLALWDSKLKNFSNVFIQWQFHT
jgi:ribosomal protein S3AE